VKKSNLITFCGVEANPHSRAIVIVPDELLGKFIRWLSQETLAIPQVVNEVTPTEDKEQSRLCGCLFCLQTLKTIFWPKKSRDTAKKTALIFLIWAIPNSRRK